MGMKFFKGENIWDSHGPRGPAMLQPLAAASRDGKNHDFFKKIENIEKIENIGYFRYISDFFDFFMH